MRSAQVFQASANDERHAGRRRRRGQRSVGAQCVCMCAVRHARPHTRTHTGDDLLRSERTTHPLTGAIHVEFFSHSMRTNSLWDLSGVEKGRTKNRRIARNIIDIIFHNMALFH